MAVGDSDVYELQILNMKVLGVVKRVTKYFTEISILDSVNKVDVSSSVSLWTSFLLFNIF